MPVKYPLGISEKNPQAISSENLPGNLKKMTGMLSRISLGIARKMLPVIALENSEFPLEIPPKIFQRLPQKST